MWWLPLLKVFSSKQHTQLLLKVCRTLQELWHIEICAGCCLRWGTWYYLWIAFQNAVALQLWRCEKRLQSPECFLAGTGYPRSYAESKTACLNIVWLSLSMQKYANWKKIMTWLLWRPLCWIQLKSCSMFRDFLQFLWWLKICGIHFLQLFQWSWRAKMSKPGVVRIVPRSPNSGHLVPKVVNMTSVGTPVPPTILGQSFQRVTTVTTPSYVVNGLQTSGSGRVLHRAPVAPVAPVRVPVAPPVAAPVAAPVVSGPRHLRQPSLTYTVVGPARQMPSATKVTSTAVAPAMMTMSPQKPRA